MLLEAMPLAIKEGAPWVSGLSLFCLVFLSVLARKRDYHSVVRNIRQDFPFFRSGNPTIYLDSAATSLKPQAVIQSLADTYANYPANVHRSVYRLAEESTNRYEGARQVARQFFGLGSEHALIFTRNATESLNLVAQTWALTNVQAGDVILTSVLEHHANLVPWQRVCQAKGANLVFCPLEEGELKISTLQTLVDAHGPRLKLVALSLESNVLGSRLRDFQLLKLPASSKLLLDACQYASHRPIDFQKEFAGVDFLVASGHKIFGPTVGYLVASQAALQEMPPFLVGGEMIDQVRLRESTFAEGASKFEAGTPAIAETIGASEGLKYLMNIREHAEEYGDYLGNQLRSAIRSALPDAQIYGHATNHSGIVALNLPDLHAYDIATLMDAQHQIGLRSGHHCCQPLHREIFQKPGSLRFSPSVYTTEEECEQGLNALVEAVRLLREGGASSNA